MRKRATEYRVVGTGPIPGKPWEIERRSVAPWAGRWVPCFVGPSATRAEAVEGVAVIWRVCDSFLADQAARERPWWRRLSRPLLSSWRDG